MFFVINHKDRIFLMFKEWHDNVIENTIGFNKNENHIIIA